MNFSNRLILYPSFLSFNESTPKIDTEDVLSLLSKHGLISNLGSTNKWFYKNKLYYLAGDNFLKYITFMGCSPAIETKPNKDNLPGANFIALKVQNFTELTFYPGKEKYQHRCINCKNTILLEKHNPLSKSDLFSCTHCNNQFNYLQTNWRHNAGISHLFIEICGIFNGEAIPSDSLLNLLSKHNNQNNSWNYFYAQ